VTNPPEARLRLGGCDLRLLGTIQGFVPEEARVRDAFSGDPPDLVALGVPPDDLPALEALRTAAQAAQEDLVGPDAASERLLQLLGRFGPTRIPSPDLEAAYGLAREAAVPVEGIDVDDASHSAEYVKRVKVRHLWRAPKREARLLAKGFESAPDPYELVRLWDAEAHASRPLREMEALREAWMARRLREVCAGRSRVLALVPAARWQGIVALLQAS
jgi:hypothetical protein